MFHLYSTFCPHFVFIFSTFWKLREVYMLKNIPHDSLFKLWMSENPGPVQWLSRNQDLSRETILSDKIPFL